MSPPDQDIQRRCPVWDALSSFFLDTELDVDRHRRIAEAIVASGYTPLEIQTILWDEVYPVLESNLRNPVGEWAGFNSDWIQEQILSGQHRRTLLMQVAGALPFGPARMVREAWQELLPFLPEHFRHDTNDT